MRRLSSVSRFLPTLQRNAKALALRAVCPTSNYFTCKCGNDIKYTCILKTKISRAISRQERGKHQERKKEKLIFAKRQNDLIRLTEERALVVIRLKESTKTSYAGVSITNK